MLYEVESNAGIYETRPNIKNLFGFTVLEAASSDDLQRLKDKEPLDREGEPDWWLSAIAEMCVWRYMCVCGQWEDSTHDEVICNEIMEELI